MNNYVLGFCIHPSAEYILLIRKNKPEWQKGKLNGIGGKIEENETPIQAMIREFKEETSINYPIWVERIILEKEEDFTVHVFATIYDFIDKYKSITDEEVISYPMYDIWSKDKNDVIPNLKWIIPILLDTEVSPIQTIKY